jgi:zinc protease
LLIAVGDFSTESLLADIERIFGDWRGPEPEPQFVPSPPRRTSRQIYLVHLPGSVQTQVLIGNLAITRHNPDWYRLVLANSIFGGAFHSRLIVNVREQKGYTYDARSSVTPLRQHGFFSVHAAVRNDVVAASLTEILYEMDRIRSVPVTADELESARSYLAGVFSLGIATQDGLSTQLSTQYLDRLPEDYLETYRERIRALTGEDVLLAARRHFDSANAQIVVVGDREQISEQAALFGHMEVFDAHGQPLQLVVP